MTDIDERINRIQVGVSDPLYLEPTRRFLARLPIPRDVVEVIVEPTPRPATGPLLEINAPTGRVRSQDLNDPLRPVPAGARIRGYVPGNPVEIYPCTLGYNLVRWANNEIQPERYFITNSHCLPDFGVMSGRSVAQPQSGGYLAIETVDPSFFACGSVHPIVPSSWDCRFGDVALAQYDLDSIFPDVGKVAMPGFEQTSFTATATITEVYPPEVGRPVRMIGATSGRRHGTIDRSCAHIQYDGQQIVLLCQARASHTSANGDSGAPLVELLGDGSTAWGVGLNWAETYSGKTWFTPLYSALNELYPGAGVLDPTASPSEPPILPTPPPDVEVAIYGMTLVGPTTNCSWTAAVTGGEAPYDYTWTGLLTGSNWFVSGMMTTSGYLQVTVVDALGVERSASLLIDYDPEAELDCM